MRPSARATTRPEPPNRSFTGQDQDTVPGVYDYLFRKYDPAAGRWLSPDPAGWAVVDQSTPQSLDRYAYVQNNPMTLIDPSGLDCSYSDDDSISEDDYCDNGSEVDSIWDSGGEYYVGSGNSLVVDAAPYFTCSGKPGDPCVLHTNGVGFLSDCDPSSNEYCNMQYQKLLQQLGLFQTSPMNANANAGGSGAPNNGRTPIFCTTGICSAPTFTLKDYVDAISHLPSCGQVKNGLQTIAREGAAIEIIAWAAPPAWAVPEIPAGGAAAIGAAELVGDGMEYIPGCK